MPSFPPAVTRVALAACLVLSALSTRLRADDSQPEPLPFLSPLFADNMVLQRGKPNNFWGWSSPGDPVSVTIGKAQAYAMAGADGRWQVQLTPPDVTGECTVDIYGSRHRVLHHVLVGDVWLCAGQSNMAFGLPGVKDAAKEIAAADHPNIRFFTVGSNSAYQPTEIPRGHWKVCTPTTVAEGPGLSAVAYFFACKVQAETGIPIGLVVDSVGGTPIECWMDPTTLEKMPDFAKPMSEVARVRDLPGPQYGSYVMHWLDEYDRGALGDSWGAINLDERGWKLVQVPGAFEQLGLSKVPAVVWFRRQVTLPDPLPEGVPLINLGVIEKMDTVYVNGRWVGASSWVENPRTYRIGEGILHPGLNQIAIRVFKVKSTQGFMGDPSDLRLDFPNLSVPLAGEWKSVVSVDARPPHPLPLGYENYPTMPSVLFQGMITPVAPMAITGALWYQGEANSSRAHQYRTLLPALIADWRRAFAQGDFPFLIAQLPAFEARRADPGSDDWAELREAQALTALHVANTGLAVTIDTGEAGTIHPKDKRPVGERLALLALATTYGKKALVASGPTCRVATPSGRDIRVQFDHADAGLVTHGDTLGEFSVAGADQKWHWAKARIEGNDAVVVSSDEVTAPVAVRYAWQANPQATLFNGAGLPAAPFRSDDWPGVTDSAPPW